MTAGPFFQYATRAHQLVEAPEGEKAPIQERRDRELEDYLGLMRRVHANEKVIAAAPDSQSTTGTGWLTLLSGTADVKLSFTKLLTSSLLTVQLLGSNYANTATGLHDYGVKIGSTDHYIAKFFFNNTGVHHSWGGMKQISGVGAGTFDCTVRYRSNAGAGTSVDFDPNDTVYLLVREVPQ